MLLQKKLILKNSVLDYIKYKQLDWYGHVRTGIDEKRLPRKILEWCPPGGRRKRRPRNSWMKEVTRGMREKGINNMELVDREELRKKLNFRHKKMCKHRYSK